MLRRSREEKRPLLTPASWTLSIAGATAGFGGLNFLRDWAVFNDLIDDGSDPQGESLAGALMITFMITAAIAGATSITVTCLYLASKSALVKARCVHASSYMIHASSFS